MIYLDYIKYLIKAQDAYGLHSPFLFEFYNEVIKEKGNQQTFEAIEQLRGRLLKDDAFIELQDFGAGSKLSQSNFRKINSIARHSLQSPTYARLFHRIIEKFSYKNIIELGTSLGITTAYLAWGKPDVTIYTFEGCKNTSALAQENFKYLGLENIQLILGNINQTLPEMLNQIDKLDLVIFDANHQYEATMHYFELCLDKINDDSCFIFDDIYWSEGMKKAWDSIKNHPKVIVTIDLFQVGIVFFRKKQVKQHFVLKF